jgi:hypothetical protein
LSRGVRRVAQDRARTLDKQYLKQPRIKIKNSKKPLDKFKKLCYNIITVKSNPSQ